MAENVTIYIEPVEADVDIFVEPSITNIEICIDDCASPVGGSGSDKNYVHNQTIASTTWTVFHDLDKFPSVTIVNSAGDEMDAFVNHVDTKNLTITFAAATTGAAYIN